MEYYLDGTGRLLVNCMVPDRMAQSGAENKSKISLERQYSQAFADLV